VALRVKETDEDGIFEVAGRGELHLTILLENMRREGYELAVSKPRVVFQDVNGEKHEPMELVTADVEEQHQGGVMQALGCARVKWSTWSRTAKAACAWSTAFPPVASSGSATNSST
jgi:predicted membrane GTPase involved in stress response